MANDKQEARQLELVDNELEWKGTGLGRVQTIRNLKSELARVRGLLQRGRELLLDVHGKAHEAYKHECEWCKWLSEAKSERGAESVEMGGENWPNAKNNPSKEKGED